MSSRAGVRDKVRGEYRVSSLMKQNKKAKMCFVIYIAGFFFEKISVMKCLRSKKTLNAADSTTYVSRCTVYSTLCMLVFKNTKRTWELSIMSQKNVNSKQTWELSADPRQCNTTCPVALRAPNEICTYQAPGIHRSESFHSR